MLCLVAMIVDWRSDAIPMCCGKCAMVDTDGLETRGGAPGHDGAEAIVAGSVTFMVEYRRLKQGETEVFGPSVRVLGTDDGHEYLRFDMFNIEPHYHYSPPASPDGGGSDRRVSLDTAAEGEPVTWAMSRLRARLSQMLAAAGGQRLADILDQEELGRAIDEVGKLVR